MVFPLSVSESTSDWISGHYGSTKSQLIYAAFTTPMNSITGSAVCAFSLQDISDTFEGNFKEQTELNSNWLPVLSSKVRHAACVFKLRNLRQNFPRFSNPKELTYHARFQFLKAKV